MAVTMVFPMDRGLCMMGVEGKIPLVVVPVLSAFAAQDIAIYGYTSLVVAQSSLKTLPLTIIPSCCLVFYHPLSPVPLLYLPQVTPLFPGLRLSLPPSQLLLPLQTRTLLPWLLLVRPTDILMRILSVTTCRQYFCWTSKGRTSPRLVPFQVSSLWSKLKRLQCWG